MVSAVPTKTETSDSSDIGPSMTATTSQDTNNEETTSVGLGSSDVAEGSALTRRSTRIAKRLTKKSYRMRTTHARSCSKEIAFHNVHRLKFRALDKVLDTAIDKLMWESAYRPSKTTLPSSESNIELPPFALAASPAYSQTDMSSLPPAPFGPPSQHSDDYNQYFKSSPGHEMHSKVSNPPPSLQSTLMSEHNPKSPNSKVKTLEKRLQAAYQQIESDRLVKRDMAHHYETLTRQYQAKSFENTKLETEKRQLKEQFSRRIGVAYAVLSTGEAVTGTQYNDYGHVEEPSG